MRRALLLAVLAGPVALVATGSAARAAGSVCPTSNPPNELVLAGGSGQTGQLGKQFPQSLQVELANTNGCPLTGNLAGVYVTFDAPGGGASGIFAGSGTHIAIVGTDSQGVATAPPFTANYTAGDYTVDAQSDYGTVELYMSNTANELASAIATTGTTSQEATVNSAYGLPLEARVTDANGNPVQGATVSFAVVPGVTGAGATFLGGGQASATTDSNGLATSPPVLANNTPGKFMVTASTDGVSTVATYTLDNHAAATTVQPVSTGDPKATVDARYQQSLQARVLNANGQPIEGATVAFAIAAADNGAGGSFLGGTAQATALTDADGVASAPPLIANKTAGTFTATASVPGARPVQFTLDNLAGTPASIAAGAASGESGTVGTRFPIPLAVTVTDKNGNPVAGATVTFTAPAKGASGHFTMRGRTRRVHGHLKPGRLLSRLRVAVKTNAKGVAVAPPFTAEASAGGYAVTATVKGTSLRAAFSLLNLAR